LDSERHHHAATPPAGWTAQNCPVGKSIAEIVSDKQVLKIFSHKKSLD
jgi:hypothetical protein